MLVREGFSKDKTLVFKVKYSKRILQCLHCDFVKVLPVDAKDDVVDSLITLHEAGNGHKVMEGDDLQ